MKIIFHTAGFSIATERNKIGNNEKRAELDATNVIIHYFETFCLYRRFGENIL